MIPIYLRGAANHGIGSSAGFGGRIGRIQRGGGGPHGGALMTGGGGGGRAEEEEEEAEEPS